MSFNKNIKLRSNVLPKTWYDRSITLFVLIIIPTVYWFELWIVLPKFYDSYNLKYMFHFITGNFIMFNVVSNYAGLLLIDTSIQGIVLKPTNDWRLCAVCETLTPPRSWHCDVCNTCILKRDHHCVFSGCCVGHNNLRYFIYFVFYLFIATLYSCYFNYFFVSQITNFYSWGSVLKIVFPLATLLLDYNAEQLYLFVTLIVFIACIFTGVLLWFHVDLMLQGAVTPERKRISRDYDLGRLDNLKEVLGTNWYMTWLSPFINSSLPHDGQNFIKASMAKIE